MRNSPEEVTAISEYDGSLW